MVQKLLYKLIQDKCRSLYRTEIKQQQNKFSCKLKSNLPLNDKQSFIRRVPTRSSKLPRLSKNNLFLPAELL